jgi:hypothetical protein
LAGARAGVIVEMVIGFGRLGGHFHQALLLYFMRLSKMRFRALFAHLCVYQNFNFAPFGLVYPVYQNLDFAHPT